MNKVYSYNNISLGATSQSSSVKAAVGRCGLERTWPDDRRLMLLNMGS